MKKSILLCAIFVFLFTTLSLVSAERYHSNRRGKQMKRGTSTTTTRTTTPKPDIYSQPAQALAPEALPVPLGPKKLVAVAEFENKTNWQGQANLGVGMADQLITALMNTNRFMVLERESIEAVLREQDFGASSRTTGEGGAKIGSISRAQILVQGAVTEFEQSSSGGAGGVMIEGFTFSASEAKAHVAVDVRIYDTTTGQIIASKACKGVAKASGGSFGYQDSGGWGFSAGGEAKTPLDFAVRDAIPQAVYFIALELDKIPWSGRVAMIKGNDVYINCGRTAGIIESDRFSVWKKGESIIDPETGIDLGSEDSKIGEIEVIKVEEKYSKAIPIGGTGFEHNDVVRYEGRKPPAPEPLPTQQPVIEVK